MDRQFRKDLIWERARDVQEIRDRLAEIKKAIKYRGMPCMELLREEKVLEWVLNHNKSLDDYYKEQYGCLH